MKVEMQQRIVEFIDDVQLVAPEQAKIINAARDLFNKTNQFRLAR